MLRLEHKGYIYLNETDQRDDGCDVETGAPIILEINIHAVESPTGERLRMDFSPWHTVSQVEFTLWVDLGCPGRIGNHPLTFKDLAFLALAKASVGDAAAEFC